MPLKILNEDIVKKLKPSLSISTDMPKTSNGSLCSKKNVSEFNQDIITFYREWLVIVDDDTILSVNKLLELLECYSRTNNEPIAIGQRYGFRVAR